LTLACALFSPVLARETLEEAGASLPPPSSSSRTPPSNSLASSSGELNLCEHTAVHVRELISYRAYNTGTLMSVFPQDSTSPAAGLPFGLQEYYAQYPDSNGDLLFLAMPIAAVRSLPLFLSFSSFSRRRSLAFADQSLPHLVDLPQRSPSQPAQPHDHNSGYVRFRRRKPRCWKNEDCVVRVN
jgi:hypothetical protein